MTTTFEPTSLEAILLALSPLGHISVSGVKQHGTCPEQYRRVKVLGQKARPSAAMEWGNADHAAAGFNYQKKIDTEKDLPVGEVQEFFVNDFERRVDENGGADEIDWDGDKGFDEKTPKQSVAVVKDKGSKLVAIYHEQIASEYFPESVEELVLFQPEGLSLDVRGYIDVVAKHRDGFTRELSEPMILERKTRGKISKPKPADLFQSRVYQLAKPYPAEFHISSRPNAKVERYGPNPVEPPGATIAMLESAILEIAHNYAIYGPDKPWPGRGRLHDWACSYCAFQSSCPYWHEEFWPK